jgi:hypothetical protein
MAMSLVVTREFGNYTRGAVITDAAAIATILAGSQAAHVVKVGVAAKVVATVATAKATTSAATTPTPAQTVATLEAELVAAVAAEAKSGS